MTGDIPQFELEPVRPATVGYCGMIGKTYFMPSTIHPTSVLRKFRSALAGASLLAPFVNIIPAQAAGMTVLGVTVGSLEVIQFSMFIGAMSAALLAIRCAARQPRFKNRRLGSHCREAGSYRRSFARKWCTIGPFPFFGLWSMGNPKFSSRAGNHDQRVT
jgi:hypothetical protein